MKIKIISVPSNSNATGWKHDDGGILNKVNSSNANFVNRLKNPNRSFIPDWESSSIATHKLSVGTDEYGNHFIYPEVQEVNGKLIDYSRPPYNVFAGQDYAVSIGDTVRIGNTDKALEDAIRFTETYKDHYPKGKTFASGGSMTHGGVFSNGVTTIGNGDTHEENPYDGVQMGVDPNGIPNLVEENEVVWNNYVFSDRLKANKEIRSKYKLRGTKDISFADVAKKISKESEERPNDPISKNGLEANMSQLAIEQEQLKMRNNKNNTRNNRFDKGGFATNLRYMPLVGNLAGIAQNVLSRPDYSAAERLNEMTADLTSAPRIGYTPLGDYISYTPVDTNIMTNKLAAESAGVRNALSNTSSPARNAALLAADYNAQNALGDAYMKAQEQNLARRQAVASFNRGTNQANAEMGLKASMANAEIAQKAKQLGLQAILSSIQARNAVATARNAALNTNINQFMTGLGNIGTEQYRMKLLSTGNYGYDKDGNLIYTGSNSAPTNYTPADFNDIPSLPLYIGRRKYSIPSPIDNPIPNRNRLFPI